MAVTDYRISKLREYLFGIINSMTISRNYQISADFLGDIGNFSLDKMPTEPYVEDWIIGGGVKKMYIRLEVVKHIRKIQLTI